MNTLFALIILAQLVPGNEALVANGSPYGGINYYPELEVSVSQAAKDTDDCRHPDGALYKDHWEACSAYVDYVNPLVWHPNGDTYKNNYNACLQYVIDVQPFLDACLTPPPHECGVFADGVGTGRLWKPVSENDGRLVVLMPPEYAGSHAVVTTTTGDIVSQLTSQSCCSNGDRAHFRFDKPGAAMVGPVVLEVGEDCWTIETPERRID